jgi:hypothetical protein
MLIVHFIYVSLNKIIAFEMGTLVVRQLKQNLINKSDTGFFFAS